MSVNDLFVIPELNYSSYSTVRKQEDRQTENKVASLLLESLLLTSSHGHFASL